MSLHSLAHHLQSAGRGDDKVLVHMTPKEVGGLQALARAHGGSLTINPHTGLPEAGFLSSLLPMLAGFALGPAGFALMSAPMAGLAVGAATGLATGDLKKGLMAGIGAYGGAGLGAGLSQAGTSAANVNAAMSGTNTAANLGTQAFPANSAIESATAGSTVGSTAGAVPSAFNYTPQGIYNPLGAPVQGQMNLANSAFVPNASVPTVPPVNAINQNILSSPMLTQGSSAASVPSTLSATPPAELSQFDKLQAGVKSLGEPGGFSNLYDKMPTGSVAALGITALDAARQEPAQPKKDEALIRPYEFSREVNPGSFDTGAPIWSSTPGSSAEKTYFTERMTPLTPYKAPGPEYAAKGGLMGLAVGGPVETMSAENAVGGNLMYPQANINTSMYSNPAVQRPEAVNIIAPSADAGVGAYTGEARFAFGGEAKAPPMKGGYSYSYDPQTLSFTQTGRPEYDTSKSSSPFAKVLMQAVAAKNPMPANGTTYGGITQPAMQAAPAQPAYTPPPIPAYQTPEQQLGLGGFYNDMNSQLGMMGYAAGGVPHLGDYSDGGRLLKGPGDGVSDSIPATIGDRQPARLADGEFVVPARIVSELGNGSTDAGAKRLYAMMDRVQKARRKTVGKDKVAANTNAEKYLPA